MIPKIYAGLFTALLMMPMWAQGQVLNTIPTSRGSKPIRILCIEGGGVRGIIPARILQEFEEKTGKPVHELFDIIIGASTGGILGLGLTMPHPEQPPKAMYTAKDCVEFYLEQSPRIFQKSFWRTMLSGAGIWQPKYDRRNFDAALEEFFQEARLAQALCPVGVLSYSLEKQRPRLWSSYVAQEEAAKNQYMRDAAAVTSAAPGYFSPKAIVSSKGTEHLIDLDGGIYVNNPALASIVAATHLYPDVQRKELIVVSLGTGRQRAKHRDERRDIRTVRQLIRAMSHTTEMFVDAALEALFPHNCYELDVVLPQELRPMDSANRTHIQLLAQHAERLIEDEQEKIEELLQRLRR